MEDRGLIELVAVDGLSVRDAAKALGYSHVAARVRLHRARRLLQERIEPLHRMSAAHSNRGGSGGSAPPLR